MELTQREKEIISLLADGHTDEAVAARMGISRRSIAYAISGLMQRHDITNRFQLGLLLGAQIDELSNEEGEAPL